MRIGTISKPTSLLSACLMVACAATPKFDESIYATGLTPSEVVAGIDAAQGDAVMWGGAIVNSVNTDKGTQLEVLAYPLNRQQRPNEKEPAWGRFLAVKDGYLETMDFAQGRQVTVIGTITGLQQGKIGDAAYTYPLVKIDDVFLWPVEQASSGPRFSIGVGVGVGL